MSEEKPKASESALIKVTGPILGYEPNSIHPADTFPDIQRHLRLGNIEIIGDLKIDRSKSHEDQMNDLMEELEKLTEQKEELRVKHDAVVAELNSTITKLHALEGTTSELQKKAGQVDDVLKENESLRNQLQAMSKAKKDKG